MLNILDKSSLLQAARGTRDLFGRQLQAIRHFEQILASLASRRGYQEIETPVLERKTVFTRSLGAETDVVAKEMFAVSGSESDPLVLRPEGTACAMRAHLGAGTAAKGLQRYWYAGPMFRYERPQAGRYRQFRQAGLEAVGADGVELDVESVWLCWKAVQQALLTAGRPDAAASLTMRVNSLGSDEERRTYSASLRQYFLGCTNLSSASSERLQAGGSALGILDSKHPEDIAARERAPPISEFWGAQSRQRFQDTQCALQELQVPVQYDATLARGLDYYNGLCWELQADRGASSQGARALTLAGGGRYDGLAESMGSKHRVPAVGWAAGVDRVAALLEQSDSISQSESVRYAVICISAAPAVSRLAREAATALSQAAANVIVELDPVARKPNKALKTASALRSSHVVLVGDDEAACGLLAVKNMGDRSQRLLSIDELLAHCVEQEAALIHL